MALKFGQVVRILVTDVNGGVVIESNQLRVDFDIRHLNGYARAKVDIYNLIPTTVSALEGGRISIFTSLHGQPEQLIADKLTVSNVVDQPVVPSNITSLYCFSFSRLAVTENQIDIDIPKPTLKRLIEGILSNAGWEGKIEYWDFPTGYLDYEPPRGTGKHVGSAEEQLMKLGAMHGFKFYLENDVIRIMYIATATNQASTDFATRPLDVVLDTLNMRSQPKIGPGQLKIAANLDANIKPCGILDISNIMFADTSVGPDTLELVQGFISDKLSGLTRYQTVSVQHKGSNYTSQWTTFAVGYSPTEGNIMNSEAWFA
jgi:hypothetical protein